MYGARASFKDARSFSSLGRESNSSLLDQIAIAMTYTFIHKRWQIEEGVSGEVTVQSMYLDASDKNDRLTLSLSSADDPN